MRHSLDRWTSRLCMSCIQVGNDLQFSSLCAPVTADQTTIQCYNITILRIAIFSRGHSTIGIGVEDKAISHLLHCPLCLKPSSDRRCQKWKHAKTVPSKPPSRTPRPGLVKHLMAGLLTCGSALGQPSRSCGPVAVWPCSPLTVAGAVTELAPFGKPHRIPFSSRGNTTGNHQSIECPRTPDTSMIKSKAPNSGRGSSAGNHVSVAPTEWVGLRAEFVWPRLSIVGVFGN